MVGSRSVHVGVEHGWVSGQQLGDLGRVAGSLHVGNTVLPEAVKLPGMGRGEGKEVRDSCSGVK